MASGTGAKLFSKFVKGTPKGKSPNYGKFKAEIIRKRLEALKAERKELKGKTYSKKKEDLDYLIRKEKTKLSKAVNLDRIDKAGERAIVPERVSEVRKETGKFVGTTKKGLKPVNKMTKVEKQDYDFEKFEKGLKRRLMNNVQKGEPAVYKGTDYTSMLNTKRGIKADPAGVGNSTRTSLKSKPSKRKGPKGPVSLGGSAKVGGSGKSYGGKVETERKKKSGFTVGGSFDKGVKRKKGGKVGKPKGIGCATRGYGKAMK